MTNRWMFDTINTHRPISTHIGTICKAASVAGLTEGKILYSFVLICRFWFNAIFLNTDRSVLFDPRSSGSLPKGLPLEPALRDIQSFVSRRELFQFSGIFRPITFPFFLKSLGMFLTVGTAPCTVALMQSNSDPHMQRALLDRANF